MFRENLKNFEQPLSISELDPIKLLDTFDKNGKLSANDKKAYPMLKGVYQNALTCKEGMTRGQCEELKEKSEASLLDMIANIYEKDEDFSNAIKWGEKVGKKNIATYIECSELLTRCYLRVERYEDARKKAKEYTGYRAKNASVWLYLALADFKLKDVSPYNKKDFTSKHKDYIAIRQECFDACKRILELGVLKEQATNILMQDGIELADAYREIGEYEIAKPIYDEILKHGDNKSK